MASTHMSRRLRISIHALREESDLVILSPLPHMPIFQSTLSVRRATRFLSNEVNSFSISIHALREESDESGVGCPPCVAISIHALREESDSSWPATPSALLISIHALREESDPTYLLGGISFRISIHALREESDGTAQELDQRVSKFQSTLSVRRATWLSGRRVRTG